MAPTSAVVSAASSSRWSTNARWNCSRQWILRSTSVAQDEVSNALRAAAAAASASATVPCGAYPITSPVAGLMEGNVSAVSTSFPPISIRRSGRVCDPSEPVSACPLLEIVDVSDIHTPSL